MATASAVLSSRDPGPYIAFATNGVQFRSGSGPDDDQEWVSVRVVIMELGHAQWGFLAAEMTTAVLPELTMMIDQTFWFEANEVLSVVQIAQLSGVPHGNWMTYRFKFSDALDFADCVRAIAEAKSQVLYHRLRMIDALLDGFQRQVREQPDRASTPEATPSDSIAAGEAADNRNEGSAPLPQPGPAIAVGHPLGPVSTPDASVPASMANGGQ